MGQVIAFAPLQPTALPRIIFGRAMIHRLTKLAAELTGIPYDELVGPGHRRDLCFTRFAVMLVAREHGKTLNQIGFVLHRIDHTTVRSGVHRAQALEVEDPDFAELVRLLREEARR